MISMNAIYHSEFTKRGLAPASSALLMVGLCLGLAARGLAQHEHQAKVLNEPAVLMPGLSGLHHPVSTKHADAQKFFNQGLALIYAFNHDEARRSFEQAARLDPNLAMAFWGIALAVGPNYNESQIDPDRLLAADRALEKAADLAATATPAERAYIAALAKRFQLKADLKKCAVDYKDAMAEITRAWPEDSDAAVLYADALMNLTPWQLWSKDGKPAEHTAEIVSTLESVLKRDPDHIGANHLYIHAVEASRDPARALGSAGKLGKLAPNAGHLVHMPSHIYIRVGDNIAAARANEEAAEVDRRYIRKTGATGMYPAMYYSHNLHFALEAYNRMGNFAAARRMARQLEENVRGHIKAMPMLEGFLPSVIFVHLRFNRWDEVLQFPAPASDAPVTTVLRHYGRGVAFAATGKVNEAEAERQAFASAAKNTPGETPFGLNSAESIFKIAGHILDARIAAARGNRRAAVDGFRKAAAAHDALNYDEPPGWYYPVRESLGAALLLAGSAAEAEQVFRKDLELNPHNARSLFGLAESLKRLGKTKDAASVQKEFEAAWKNADSKLRIEDL
ncbi:MAG: tetratricopeptide repeat protein [Blastocatellia bacterium]